MPGAFRTRQDLINEALGNLGVLSPGQPVDAEDFNYCGDKLDATLRMCGALQIVYIPDPDQIPGEVFSPLADILAGECAMKFGVTQDELITLTSKGLGGLPSTVLLGQGTAAIALRTMQRGMPTGEVLQSNFF